MYNSNQEIPVSLSEKELTKPSEVFINRLPVGIAKGSTLTFEDSFYSNPDDFDFFYMSEIAKTYNLDPVKDYDKIKKLSADGGNREIIKKKLQGESLNSYNVADVIIPEASKLDVPNMDYPEDFFKRFNYLPENGMVKIYTVQMDQVEHVYIGGGLDTEAYANVQKGYYGDENKNPTYFSTDFELAMSHMQDEEGGNRPILIEVSFKKLMELRTLFQDPESLYIGSEEDKTFIAFHGIPTGAIERVLVLEKNK